MVKITHKFRQGFKYTCDQSPERGSIIVLVALALTALLGFCAIVTDVGILYAKKVQLQNSVNAAALAGVQELPSKPDLAKVKAEDYALQNGVPDVIVTFGASNVKIIVTATQQVPTYFARIWGITTNQISVSAKAMTIPLTGMKGGTVPLSIPSQVLNYGVTYNLKVGAGDGDSGWYGALDLDGKYENDLTYGSSGTLSVGQLVNKETGNMSIPSSRAIKYRIDEPDPRIPPNTIDDHDWNAPRLMYIPIVIPNGSQEEIAGFAAFWIDSLVKGQGNDSVITGRFVRELASKGYSNVSLSDLLQIEYNLENGGVVGSDFGVYSAKLVKN